MISLKKYLDMDAPARFVDEPQADEFLAATIESYRSALRAMGRTALQVCPTHGSGLEQGLASIETQLANHPTTEFVKQTEGLVGEQLQTWGGRTAEHFKGQADEVKELLLMLARTAESVGERDQRYANQFSDLTTRLKAIANLDDLTQIRASLVQRAAELKNCVDQMAKDSQQSMAQLRAKVSSYESKLQVVETLASKDTLTGLANRHSVETRIEALIAMGQTFCVVMLDLNHFKPINDKFGHAAGDDLLKQFSRELQSNVRSNDLVGRWGGDEFILVLTCNRAGAKLQIERMQKWVFGEYKIQIGAGKEPEKIRVEAAIGLTQWQPGDTLQQLIEEADAAMYRDKQLSR